MSRWYTKQSVYDAALARIRYLFDEFPEVIVNFSGGKDSTVILQLALQVAQEKGRLPLKVFFLDQEAEWNVVIDYIRRTMQDPRIDPLWLQCQFRLANATSERDKWLVCWDEAAPGEWIRPKEPNSIQVNRYGTDRFAELFGAFLRVDFPHTSVARLAGVRTEESPARRLGLTTYATYKHVTYGKVEDKRLGHYTFYPLYDWTYKDVWKAIHENGWPYCELYDLMYQYGTPVNQMRVSNVHHETAVHTLFFLQEIEPDTWAKITTRVKGINSAGILQKDFTLPRELPYMFSSWREYRDYLLDRLITDPKRHATMRAQFDRQDARFDEGIHGEMHRMHVSAILVNDYEGIKMTVFEAKKSKWSKTSNNPYKDGREAYRGW